jgi:hypothetical protein
MINVTNGNKFMPFFCSFIFKSKTKKKIRKKKQPNISQSYFLGVFLCSTFRFIPLNKSNKVFFELLCVHNLDFASGSPKKKKKVATNYPISTKPKRKIIMYSL